MLPDCEDVVAKVSDPNATQFFILWLRLVRKGGNEGAARNASSISDRPALVLEAVDKSLEQCRNMLSKWFLSLIINGDLVADLANAVASCFSNRMVIGL